MDVKIKFISDIRKRLYCCEISVIISAEGMFTLRDLAANVDEKCRTADDVYIPPLTYISLGFQTSVLYTMGSERARLKRRERGKKKKEPGVVNRM